MTVNRFGLEGCISLALLRVLHEIQNAHIYYKLFRDLRKRIRGYQREYNNSPAFWGLTMNAHLLATISCLCRAYDHHRDGLNLKRLLETLRDSANEPFGGAAVPSARRFERDIKSVGYDDPLAKKLLWQRNNIYAHLNRQNVVKNAVHQAAFTLPHAQFKKLLDRAARIINRYGQLYIRNTWSLTIMGDGDYMHVLKASRDWSVNYERKLREEEKEFRQRRAKRRRASRQ